MGGVCVTEVVNRPLAHAEGLARVTRSEYLRGVHHFVVFVSAASVSAPMNPTACESKKKSTMTSAPCFSPRCQKNSCEIRDIPTPSRNTAVRRDHIEKRHCEDPHDRFFSSSSMLLCA